MKFPAPPGYAGRPPREWPVPAMDHSAGARDSGYTPAMGRLILARIAAGETVKAITADPRMPAYCTVYHWRAVDPEFGRAWAELRARMAAEKIRRRDEARVNRLAERELLAGAGLGRLYRGGRRGSYTPALARRVCAAVAAGAPLSHALARPGMPSAKAVYGWLRTRATFRRMYAEACRRREAELRWEIEMAADRVMGGTAGPAAFAEAMATVARLEGRIGRLRPRTYRQA